MRSVHHVMFLASAVGLCKSGEAQQLVKATLLSDAIHLDTSQVKAGPVTFDVHNDADNNMVHELVVLKTSLAALPVRNGQVRERKFRKMGEVEDVAPGSGQSGMPVRSAQERRALASSGRYLPFSKHN